MAGNQLPPTARSIALLLASTPTIQDSHPAVLHQLLEFSHRYASQILSDALVYSEHAGRAGKLEMEDAGLAVQARVGWEFGGRVPKEYLLSLAAQTNATPLPPVSEAFGIRLPPSKDRLTAVNFDLVPNRMPPGINLYEEEVEEEVTESEEEDDMQGIEEQPKPRGPVAPPIMARDSSADDVDMARPTSEVSDGDDGEDGLFGADDGGDDASDAEVNQTQQTQRTLVEDEEYD
ncbi:TFIID-31kDa-domain-containing protein [Hysterangium stoloniferum]|nr:TFIID-31kDa-domain-containing protein [Hysterangium stoloniferum]